MNPARRQSMSNQMKQRWSNIKIIAAHLDVETDDVAAYLYQTIKEANKVEEAVAGHIPTLEWIKASEMWTRLQEKQTNTARVYNPSRRKNDDDDMTTPDSQIRVALWFLRKIGDATRAKEALNIAIQATERLAKKQ